MDSEPLYHDITPHERALLSRLRFRPEAFLGACSLRNFRQMSNGYQFAMLTAGLRDRHNLLPEGLREFTAQYLNISPGTQDWFTMLSEREPDDAKALTLFFRVLDAFLEANGLEPLVRVDNWEGFRSLWTEEITYQEAVE